jgi:parallel beta-helix repeat protein
MRICFYRRECYKITETGENTLNRKQLVVGLIFLLIGANIIPITAQNFEKHTLSGNWLYVGGSGPGNYTTIQSAVDAANPGDSVFVYNGTYNEYVIINQNNVNINGENRNTTIIDATNLGYCFYANNKHGNCISNFSLKKSNGNGIRLDNSYSNLISDCIIFDTNSQGIHLCNSDSNTIKNCDIYQNLDHGILLNGWCTNNQILNCKIHHNSNDGIIIGDGSNLMYNIIVNCEISNNTHHGVWLLYAVANTISNCSIVDNGLYGIYVVSSIDNYIYQNSFVDNNQYGIYVSSCINNHIYHNNFDDNNQNAFDNGGCIWYDSGLLEGNFWSDYFGTDSNQDGIGDIPYNISGGSNQDLYPFMYPDGWTLPSYVWVDDDFNSSTYGWGYDHFSSIQEGIDAVEENGTVYVFNGLYNPISIGKTISLIGEDRMNTKIINSSTNQCIKIGYEMSSNATGVQISNFFLENGKLNTQAIEMLTSNNRISNCYFKDSFVGIYIEPESNNNIVENCVFEGFASGYYSYGMMIGYAINNLIRNCTFQQTPQTGIYIYYSLYNTISNCSFQSYKWGVVLWGSDQHRVEKSSFTGINEKPALFIACHSDNNTIKENLFNDNNIGVSISYNTWYSNNNKLFNNCFQDNNIDAKDDCVNIWDNGYPDGGNYWSDYTGSDIYHGSNQNIPGSDGMGDTPYNIPSGINQDLYPIKNPPTNPPDYVWIDKEFNSSTSGWGFNHFSNIQDGINAVDVGGTVFVYTGIYYENLQVTKNINLTGNDKNNTIIDGRQISDVITISSSNSIIRGFKIQNSSSGNNYHGGIVLGGTKNKIENTNITNCHSGIVLANSHDNVIINNSLFYNSINVYCRDWSSNINITRNVIKGNSIHILSSNNISISYNRFYSPERNSIDGAYGLHDITIFNNYFEYGKCAIQLNPIGGNVIIFNNTITNQTWWGIYLCDGNGGKIYHNNFINNYRTAADYQSNNIWDNGYPSGGNYWSDYTGEDNNNDSIGDTPYYLYENTQDRYPLIYPWNGCAQNSPPYPNFTYYPENPTKLDVIFFNDTSIDLDGYFINWTWEFGDGSVSYYQNSTHQYDEVGTFLVSLTVRDNDSASNTITKTVYVHNILPTAHFTYFPSNPINIDIIQFNDSSTDSDGSIVSWWWDFDNGCYSNLQNPEFCYYVDGTYNVTLTITDDDGGIDSIQQLIVVSTPTQYTLTISIQGQGTVTKEPDQQEYTNGSIVNLTAIPDTGWLFNYWGGDMSGSENPVSIVINGNKTVIANFTMIHYSLNISVEGSGTVTQNPEQEYYTYDQIVTLTANPTNGWCFDHWSGDLAGNTNPIMFIVNGNMTITAHFMYINNPPNTPNQPTGPTTGKPGVPYDFSSSTVDLDNDQVYYKWDWGDGSFSEWLGPYDSGETLITSHIWNETGGYAIRVKAKDANDLESDWSDPLAITMPLEINHQSQQQLQVISQLKLRLN